MSNNSKCDFYCDPGILTSINSKISEQVERLQEVYSVATSTLADVQQNNDLSGSWFDSFLENYEKIDEGMLRYIASLLSFQICLEYTGATVGLLINMRDELMSSL